MMETLCDVQEENFVRQVSSQYTAIVIDNYSRLFCLNFGNFFVVFSSQVSITVTDVGSKHITEIIGMVFQYLKLIEKEGVKETVWDERQTLSELRFRFQQPFSDHMDEIRSEYSFFTIAVKIVLLHAPATLQFCC